jgi:trehalose 6-phosphate phosphatase
VKYILAQRNRSLLRRLSRAHTLLVFDFDGTLAPIVSDPREATMRPSTAALLRGVAEVYPVAIVSGRALADVTPRLEDIPVQVILGNHGIEPSPQMESAAALVRQWMPVINAAAAGLPGVMVENKRHSVTLHYRQAQNPFVARDILLKGLTPLGPEAEAADGKYVINIVPHDAPDKGDALVRLCHDNIAEYAVFVGDDVTDEDAFARTGHCRVIGIRVGRSSDSHAQYYLRTQEEMDELLGLLASLRSSDGGYQMSPTVKPSGNGSLVSST